MRKHTRGWAIEGTFGLYTGWWQTKKEAIAAHTAALGKSWYMCKQKGDSAVRIEIKIV